MRHFLLFQRTDGHCYLWLTHGETLRDALTSFILEYDRDSVQLPHGRIRSSLGSSSRKQPVELHPLEYIESAFKQEDGLRDTYFDLREVTNEAWSARDAELMCSMNPGDVFGYLEVARPAFRATHPRSRARAFVWYFEEGPLVTFHERANKRDRGSNIRVVARYLLPWKDWGKAIEWHGSADDVLDSMKVRYPFHPIG